MIKTETEEQIASFTVINENYELKQVIISQDLLSHYDGKKIYTKKYCLESLGGTPVFRTDNPDILKLADGSILKRSHR